VREREREREIYVHVYVGMDREEERSHLLHMVDFVVLSLEVSGDLSLPPIEWVEHVINLLRPLLHSSTLHIDPRE
jgi:hypothetical protein